MPILVCIRGFSRIPLSSAIIVSLIKLMSFCHIGLYFAHFQKWFPSSWLLPHEVHLILF